ncbi:hypothetical protein Ancab_034838 [Ancistrocladus abbreviatus]
MKVSDKMIKAMHNEVEKFCVPELCRLMKETKDPFVNVIYDCEPLEKKFWNNVVLVGDAAHSTTPHCARSTNMSVLDAAVLGKCLENWGLENLHLALSDYQSARLPVMAKIKQGLVLHDREPFNLKNSSPEDCHELQQRNVPFFADVPLVLR